MTGPEWNERYLIGNLPWDTNEPDENLVQLLESKTMSPGQALEIGCGTGTNAIWLAQHGFEVLGVDISQSAIDRANQKITDHSLSCDFAVLDFLHDNHLPGLYDFVFDRGCFHSFDQEADRSLFARRVSHVLKTGGIWASVIGSTEGAPRETGPPRRSAAEVVKAIEPFLEIMELRSAHFKANLPFSPRAWLCISRKRG
jgi:cyclopropane fatty-acyl-phospholipid synthase-like methyltransferase